MRRLVLVVLAILLSACATKYQAKGFSGGFSEVRLSSNVFRIDFQGNGFTNVGTARDMILLRAAEVTLQDGWSHFVIRQSDSYVEESTMVMPTTSRTTGSISTYGNTSYLNATTNTMGGVHSISKPSAYMVIEMFWVEKLPSANAYDAQLIYDQLRVRYGLPPFTKKPGGWNP